MSLDSSIQLLHDHCGVYTSASAAARLLDEIGWTETENLSSARLLEPCIGEGAILVEAVRRLIKSFKRHGVPLHQQTLLNRVVSFELHPTTHAIAIQNIVECAKIEGIRESSARKLAEYWVSQRDFLLEPVGTASHAATNPPYLRWAKVPSELQKRYNSVLDRAVVKGDLSVAFLDQILKWASPPSAKVCALVSDRWMYSQYGEAFLARLEANAWKLTVLDERPQNAFQRDVGAYAAIVAFSKTARKPKASDKKSVRGSIRETHAQLIKRMGSIVDAGCEIKVGPALGAGRTYIAERRRPPAIEAELLRPFISRGDLNGVTLSHSDGLVVSPYDRHGRLVALKEWPHFAKWAYQNSTVLKGRSIVRSNSLKWWRTIDAITPIWNVEAKLLIPEMTKDFRCTLDTSGGVPAHSIYAIFSSAWPPVALANVLNAGLLRLTAQAQAPAMQGGWYRMYKKYLSQVPLPNWDELSGPQKRTLMHRNGAAFDDAFLAIFGFSPTQPTV